MVIIPARYTFYYPALRSHRFTFNRKLCRKLPRRVFCWLICSNNKKKLPVNTRKKLSNERVRNITFLKEKFQLFFTLKQPLKQKHPIRRKKWRPPICSRTDLREAYRQLICVSTRFRNKQDTRGKLLMLLTIRDVATVDNTPSSSSSSEASWCRRALHTFPLRPNLCQFNPFSHH